MLEHKALSTKGLIETPSYINYQQLAFSPPILCGKVCSLLNVHVILAILIGKTGSLAVPGDAVPTKSVSWQVLLKLRGEIPRWKSEILHGKLRELAEFLSRTMTAEVSVLALVSEAPPVAEKTSHGGFRLDTGPSFRKIR